MPSFLRRCSIGRLLQESREGEEAAKTKSELQPASPEMGISQSPDLRSSCENSLIARA
ncbi:hypothetical protein Vi05172_g7670 [Venturia inaequalis]|nr:hypothetical protein Vi05172_g7670 [Venturia inaequalis]